MNEGTYAIRWQVYPGTCGIGTKLSDSGGHMHVVYIDIELRGVPEKVLTVRCRNHQG